MTNNVEGVESPIGDIFVEMEREFIPNNNGEQQSPRERHQDIWVEGRS